MSETDQQRQQRIEEERKRFDLLMEDLKGLHMRSPKAIHLIESTTHELIEWWIGEYPVVDENGYYTGRTVCFLNGGDEDKSDFSLVEWWDGKFHVIDPGKEGWHDTIRTPFVLDEGLTKYDFQPIWVLAFTLTKNLM